MKKIKLLIMGAFLSLISHGQDQVIDSLSGLSQIESTIHTRTVTLCDETTLTYTIETSNNSRNANGIANTTNHTTDALALPFPRTNSLTNITISFPQPVMGLRILISDLDLAQAGYDPNVDEGEWLENFNFFPSNIDVYNSIPPLTASNNSTQVTPTTNDCAGWLEWNVPIDTLTFTHRSDIDVPYLVFIEEIQFDDNSCVQDACICDADVTVSKIGIASKSGVQSARLTIDSQEPVTRLIVDIPNYLSSVNDDCINAKNANMETYGTLIGSTLPVIHNVTGQLIGDMGTGHSRKVVYNFPLPVTFPEQGNPNYIFQLQFPPVLDLGCCNNSVDFCFNTALTDENCNTCEYLECTNVATTNGNGARQNKISKQSAKTTKKEFRLKISPNPTQSSVQVNVDENDFASGEVFLYNLNGALLHNQVVNQKNFMIDTSELPSGVMTLIVVSNKGERASGQIIKK